MPDADIDGEGILQFPDLRPVDVLAVGKDLRDICIQFFRDKPLLGGQIDEIHESQILLLFSLLGPGGAGEI